MQTWKMIKTLTFSKWKKFKCIESGEVVEFKEGILQYRSGLEFIITQDNLSFEWREVII
jgi:hypothetical protein